MALANLEVSIAAAVSDLPRAWRTSLTNFLQLLQPKFEPDTRCIRWWVVDRRPLVMLPLIPCLSSGVSSPDLPPSFKFYVP